MPALAIYTLFGYTSLRSLPWAVDNNFQALDPLDVQNVPRAEVLVDFPPWDSIEEATASVFGNIDNVDNALTSLVEVISGNDLSITNLQSAASAITDSSSALDTSLNEILPPLQSVLTGPAAIMVGTAIDETNKANTELKSTISAIQNSLSEAISNIGSPEGSNALIVGQLQGISSITNELVPTATASLRKMRDALGQIKNCPKCG